MSYSTGFYSQYLIAGVRYCVLSSKSNLSFTMSNLKSALTCLLFLTVVNCEELRECWYHEYISLLSNRILPITAEFLQVCKKSDPNINGCIFESVNKLKPYLVNGIPEYDIPSLEPINLGDLIVAGSKTGQGLFITANDIKAYGASNWKLKNLK